MTAGQAQAPGSCLLSTAATRMSVLVTLSLSNPGRITPVFPSWPVVFGIVAALVLLVGTTVGVPITLVLPAWPLVHRLVILRRREQIRATAAAGPTRATPGPGHG